MVALDIDMTGVKPQGEFTELPEGKYLARIEWTDKKLAKDKFDANGVPLPSNGKNSYLQVDMKIYGGPEDGREEKVYINLWNMDETSVRIAKQTLKSIFLATGVETADSSGLHGRWLVIDVKLQKNNKLGHYYEPADPTYIPPNIPAPVPPANSQPAGGYQQHAQPPYAGSPAPAQPPAPTPAPAAAPTPAAAPAGYVAPTPSPAAPAQPAAGAASQVPAWATRKS